MRLPQALLCVFLGSCASPAQHQLEPTLDPVARHVACEARALDAYPRLLQSITVVEEKTEDTPVTCKLDGVISCAPGGERTIPAVKTTKDVNALSRKRYYNACIE